MKVMGSGAGVGCGDIPVAILAGGLATRLRPITTTIPKALVEVAGQPFIDHQLTLLHRQGIRRVVLCLGHLGEQVREHVGAGSRWGMDVHCVFDGERLLGTGGALRRALPALGEVNWVMYGDSYLDVDFDEIHHSFVRSGKPALMTVYRNQNAFDRSNVVFQEGRLLVYDKRRRTPAMTHIDYGLALVRREIVERIPPDAPCDLADMYTTLVADGMMAGHEVARRFYEIGSPAGLEETSAYLALRAG